MVELADRTAEAARKLKNLPDFEERLERAARRVAELASEREEAALVIYESVLTKSGRSPEEIRALVRRFRTTFEDEEEPLTITRVSALMKVEGEDWFFGDSALRTMTGQLLGQFQHRVAQYNYIDEREVLRRWADGYDTRLFIRRRIYDTEPVAGVVVGFDLSMMQYLRVAAGGDTLLPTPGVARALEALGFPAEADEYETLARAESLALHLELPAPLVGEVLEDLARDGVRDFPEPAAGEEAGGAEDERARGGAAPEPRDAKPAPGRRVARRDSQTDPVRGEEPTGARDPQAQAEAQAAPGSPGEDRGERPGKRDGAGS
ncbi:MAG: hypothetical protein AB1425_04240 [Actinomycetota bacterium]